MFFSFGSFAASNNVVNTKFLKEKAAATISFANTNTQSKGEQLISASSLGWWCRVIDTEVEYLGEDMYGNSIYQVTYTIGCIWVDFSPGGGG